MKKISMALMLLLTVSGIIYSQQSPSRDYEFIFTLAPGVTTSLVSNMRRDNWAFTNGGQNINDLYSLLNNSLDSPYNRTNYQRLVDYVFSSLLYIDLVGFFVQAFEIPFEDALNPQIIDVDFSPNGRLTQIDVKIKIGGHDGTLSISKFPGLFIRELSEDFHVEYQQTNNRTRLYFILGRK